MEKISTELSQLLEEPVTILLSYKQSSYKKPACNFLGLINFLKAFLEPTTTFFKAIFLDVYIDIIFICIS